MRPSNRSAGTFEENPAPFRPGLDVGSLILCAFALLLEAGLLIWIISTQAKFNAVFVEFDTLTPLLTEIVRSTAFVWLVGLLFGLTGILDFVVKNRTVRATGNMIAILAALFLGTLYAVGMFLPLSQMGGSLSG